MGVYVGRIDIRNESFYNFMPLYEFVNGSLERLQDHDYIRILPDSEKRNINFSYDTRYDVDFMEETFFPDVPVVFEFEIEDLILNYDKWGNLNQTGYKIRTHDTFNKGKIRTMAELGYYLIIEPERVVGNPKTSNVLEIGADGLTVGTKVLINLEENDMLMGPCDISPRKMDNTFVVSTKPEEHNYILTGYRSSDCHIIPIDTEYGTVVYASPCDEACALCMDIITDRALLESFKQSLGTDYLANGKLDLNNVNDAIELFSKSAFMVSDETIRNKRLQRLTELLSISDSVDDVFKYIAETIGDSFADFINKYDDRESPNSLVNTIIHTNPEILSRIPEYRFAKSRIEELQDKEEELAESIERQKKQLEGLELVSSGNNILKDLEEAEGKYKLVAQEREKLENEVEAIRRNLDQFHSFEEISSAVSELKDESNYLELRKNQLNRETSELKRNLQDVTVDMEKKLAEITIDGLVANMLVEASSSWTEKKERENLIKIVEKQDSIETASMTPAQLVEYMYARVSEVRPQYDKNTVTNICTCIFQNFLTVFSGDPGCGKTSICNIVAQALGLTRIEDIASPAINRYVPVSVERGWTSKRDFIGYYNPLTKTFDKNNKKVFDALQIADIEAKGDGSKLPMIFLLDEANLSPMEYYWADFMNVCDDLAVSNEINIGENHVFNIPESVHFVATINNDHTTETLSPRLIDRAAVITLPSVSRNFGASLNTGILNVDNIKIVSWVSIKKTYIEAEDYLMSPTARKIYEEIVRLLRQKQIYVSPRTEMAILRYYGVASRLFDINSDPIKRDRGIIALDYAIAQKILPKINGYGEEYAEWLKELHKMCEENYLIRSKEIVSDIIKKGESNMNYFQFFA